MTTEKSAVAENLDRIRERVARAAGRAGRRVEDVTIVAVSKTFPFEAIRAAYELGLRHFGENRVQEWESKQARVADLDATWHLIGHLQSNKARRAASLFDRVDSVDSLALAQKLDAAVAEGGGKSATMSSEKSRRDAGATKSGAASGKRLQISIEVSLGGEITKSGVAEADLPMLAEGVAGLANLELLGLMTIPPFLDDPEEVRPYFSKLREIRADLARRIGRALPVLSMGMSHDFEVAVEEGATEIRVGTALFGARKLNQ
ncbi:MAG TPA: YggS family pyridoxal phosphate enzyme [Candidatus Acidoferrales bacterium]|nr:YggS family pyridoxal phosphate enzyme [Candidatus Acidoferrales bacterium]